MLCRIGLLRVACAPADECIRFSQKSLRQGYVAQKEALVISLHVDRQLLEEWIASNADLLDVTGTKQFVAAVGLGFVIILDSVIRQ